MSDVFFAFPGNLCGTLVTCLLNIVNFFAASHTHELLLHSKHVFALTRCSQELRIACAVAAMERAGGIFPVVSPFAQVRARNL